MIAPADERGRRQPITREVFQNLITIETRGEACSLTGLLPPGRWTRRWCQARLDAQPSMQRRQRPTAGTRQRLRGTDRHGSTDTDVRPPSFLGFLAPHRPDSVPAGSMTDRTGTAIRLAPALELSHPGTRKRAREADSHSQRASKCWPKPWLALPVAAAPRHCSASHRFLL